MEDKEEEKVQGPSRCQVLPLHHIPHPHVVLGKKEDGRAGAGSFTGQRDRGDFRDGRASPASSRGPEGSEGDMSSESSSNWGVALLFCLGPR